MAMPMVQMHVESPRQRYDRLVSELAGKLVSGDEKKQRMENTLRSMVRVVDSMKAISDDPTATILVEVEGGLVQNVEPVGGLPHPVLVLVRDHDNLKVDPTAEDNEWLLGASNGLEGEHQPNVPNLKSLDNLKLTRLAAAVATELEQRRLRDDSYVLGYKAGFLAALRDENWGPGQVWTDEEAEGLLLELEQLFPAPIEDSSQNQTLLERHLEKFDMPQE